MTSTPELSAKTRTSVFGQLAESGVLLAAGHPGLGFGRVEVDGIGHRFAPVHPQQI